ncbi:MAG: DNRLRE domain-containing protein [Isosphaeraceae bacterium]|nr:DNRLRE domain-containing protein [Isosphaeraceae bacterium]
MSPWHRPLHALMGLLALVGSGDPAAPKAGADLRSDRPLRTVSFRSGENGFDGTIDVEIWALAPTTILDSNPNATTDANNDGGESQILLRFEGIVGEGPRRIPAGSSIKSAILTVSAFDQGDTVHLHRMLVPWPRQPTWTSLVGGVTADGFEASRRRESFTFGKIAANTSAIPFDVTDSVQAWVNGAPNHGWVFINSGGNGWDFYTHEFDDLEKRPHLVVEFTPPRSRVARSITSDQEKRP